MSPATGSQGKSDSCYFVLARVATCYGIGYTLFHTPLVFFFFFTQITNAVRSGYEMNSVDSNAIIGGHPAFTNLYMATAFSGHGIMHSSAAARGLSELILFGGYRTIDLSRLGFDRYVQESSMESEFTFC